MKKIFQNQTFKGFIDFVETLRRQRTNFSILPKNYRILRGQNAEKVIGQDYNKKLKIWNKMSSQEMDINQYQLSLMAVKMKVKFPCRMKLQHSSNTLTEQVEANDQNKFIFNQQVTIQQEAQKNFFDINIILITQKGARYVSGVLKLYHKELEKSAGEKIIVPLVKCLDNDAYCEVKVNKVKAGKAGKRLSISSSLIEMKRLNDKKTTTEEKIHSPRVKKNYGVQTRSQIGMNGISGKLNNDWEETRSKGPAQTLIYRSNFMKSPKNKKSYGLGSPKMLTQFNNQYQVQSQHTKLCQSEVYREGYEKLKQKYKKQSQTAKTQQNKRLQLQANENNYKIQIMRLKLKTEEQQRIIQEKNNKIKELQINISQIEKQQLDMSYLKEENVNLEHKIQQLNDLLASSRKENLMLKSLAEERRKKDQLIVDKLKEELEEIKTKMQSMTIQHQETLRQNTQKQKHLQTDLESFKQNCEVKQKEIQRLEQVMKQKLYEYEKSLQEEKKNGNEKKNQLLQKIEQKDKQRTQLLSKIEQLNNDKEKIKGLILKAEYDKKVLLQEQQTVRKELLNYKQLKETNRELEREVNFLKQDKMHLIKQMQYINSSKQLNIQQINEQYQNTLNHYKKKVKQTQERAKNLACQKIQLEGLVDQDKNTIEKQKRQVDSLTNEISSLKNKLKEEKTYSSGLEQQKLSLQNQISMIESKLSYGQQNYRVEAQKMREDLIRCKNELSAENLKCVQLYENKSNIEMQLNKNKIQLQYAEEKKDKLFTTNKQLQNTIENLIKQYQGQINDYQNIVDKNQQQIKNFNEKIHSYEMEKIQMHDLLQLNKKNLKLAEEKITHLEGQLKNKHHQLLRKQQTLKSNQTKLAQSQNSLLSLRHDLVVLTSEKKKIEKVIQFKQKNLQNQKQTNNKLQNQNQTLQKQQIALRTEIKQQNQKYTKLQMRLKSLEREYGKFKQVINLTVTDEFGKIPLIQTKNRNQEQRKTLVEKLALSDRQSTPGSEQNGINSSSAKSPKSQQPLSPQSKKYPIPTTIYLIQNLNDNIIDCRSTIFKLIQHNKQLKKQIQLLRQQNEQSTNKYHFSEIELQKEMQELEENFEEMYKEKEEELNNYDRLVGEMNGKLREKDALVEELTHRCEELEFIVSSLKVDFENNDLQNDKKVQGLKGIIKELEDKLEFYKVSLSNQQDVNHELQEKLQLVRNQKTELQQTQLRNKLTIQNLTVQQERFQNQLSILNKQRKSLQQKLTQVTLQLNESKDLKSKAIQSLVQEQAKCRQLKQFINRLIKQKESVIKSDLQKSDKILQFQSQIIELKRDLEINVQELQKYKSQLEILKDNYRKECASSKNYNGIATQALNKIKKIQEKCQEKERQIQMKDQIIVKQDARYKELAEKNLKETLQLHSEIDNKYIQNISLNKQVTQKITLLQAKIQELQHIKAKQHHQYILQSDELLAEKQHTALLKRQNHNLEKQLEQLRQQLSLTEKRSQQLVTQIQEREEQLSELNNRIIGLQAEIEAISKDKLLKLEEVEGDWQRKYQNIVEEYENQLSIIHKEKNLIKDQLAEKNAEIDAALTHSKNNEHGIEIIKKNYESKVKKLEEDRLNTILVKNNQIKKLNQQINQLKESLKKLELAQKENSQLLQIIRKKLTCEEKRAKEAEEKQKNQKKLHDAQITNMLRKEAIFKSQKEKLAQMIWKNQRQIKQTLQNYLKKILDQCDTTHIDKITRASKGLELEVGNILENGIQDVSLSK